jgi:hypothetical protein
MSPSSDPPHAAAWPPAPDLPALRRRLEEADQPLWESELLKAAWPGESQADWSPLELFRRHFALFATLYDLADGYLAADRYLHVHFMRTRLASLPPPETCAHWEAETGRFCALPLPCAFHPTDSRPVPADARGFYRNPANIAWMDESAATQVIGGAWQLLAGWPQAEAAWRTLELPAGSGRSRVKRRFRELARRTHPDLNPAAGPPATAEASPADFAAIRAAHDTLLGILPEEMD